MKKTTFIILVAGLIPVLGVLTFLAYSVYSVEFVQTTEIVLEIGSIYGFNVNSEKIHLGQIRPGGTVYRNITVTNDEDKERKIRIVMDQPIKRWTSLSHTSFTLPPYGNQSVLFYVNPPFDAIRGNYSSAVYVQYLR